MSGKGLVGGVILALAIATGAAAQTDVAALREQARARFDVVTLTGGVGLVPKQPIAGVRLIEVRDGAVSINGEAATAKDVRTRLGADADLVLRVTYLDAAGLATLTGAIPGGAGIVPEPPAPPAPPAPPDDDDRRRRRGRGGDRDGIVRFGGSVTVEKDERVSGEVVVFGGTARILGTVEDELVVFGGTADLQGTVEGDVSVVGGTLKLGPASVVEGDVSVAGGSIQREPGSRVDGKVDEVGVGSGGGGVVVSPGDWWRRQAPFWGTVTRVGSFFGQLWRAALLIAFALLGVAFGGRYVRPMAARAAAEPVRSGGLGLLTQVLFVPVLVITVVVLAVSIIGIPLLLLLPFALVLILIIAFLGFAGVALRLGQVVGPRVGISSESPYVQTIVGVLAVMLLSVLARAFGLLGGGFFGGFVGGTLGFVGFIAEYLAWTVGLGAAFWVLRRSRGRVPQDEPMAPPPAPPASDMGPEAFV
ncbi:MAG: hypothetical protein AB7I25_06620 [Vicinamibacterales bacterium]